MATKEAHNRASVEYNKRQDNIMIRPSKEMGAIIRQSAAAENMSVQGDRKSTRLNSSHMPKSRMPSSA